MNNKARLKRAIRWYFTNARHNDVDHYEQLEAFATAEVALVKGKCEWVKCSDRLPDKNGGYLVTRLSIPDADRLYFCFRRKIWLDFYDDDVSKVVIAWMPLPPPYTEADSEILEVVK